MEILASQNPSAHKQLCEAWGCWDRTTDDDTYRGFLQGSTDPQALSALFKTALIQDPASGYRWCDLGESLAASGDEQQAVYAVNRAVTLCPNSALILLRAANVKLLTGQNSGSLQLLARILKRTAELDQIVFSTFERFGGGTEAALRLGMPADSAPVKLSYAI